MQRNLKRFVVALALGIALAVGLAGNGTDSARHAPALVAQDPGGGGGTGG